MCSCSTGMGTTAARIRATRAQPALPPALPLLALLPLLLGAPRLTSAYPEYRDELPNVPTVNGAPWPGVGHTSASGGGLRNQFGKDFAAAGYTWSRELCRADSDGDGYSNGQELGDPDCKWKKGQPSPVPARLSMAHPGLKQSVPQLLTGPRPSATPATAAAAAAGLQGEGLLAAATPQAAAAAAASGAGAEPNADMPVPQGSEHNLNGDKPQRWCEARQAAAGQTQQGLPAGVGSNQEWLNISLPTMTVLGAPDMYSCHPIRIPDTIPPGREFVGVRVGLDGASHLHHILLMECPADLWFLADMTRNSEMCTTHSGSMFNACNRWWIATEANNDYRMCTPPGLIYARAGEMRDHNKVLVLQVHWVFGSKLQNTSVTLRNASLQLLHEDPAPTGPRSEIMETIEGTAVYPPSLMQHVNGLIIPGGQEAANASYACARRCTFVPLGGLSPRPVTIAGYTFHGHHFMTGMRMSIKRCPLTHLPDVSWEVAAWQQSVVHPTYDIMGQGVQLYPGDQLSWTCTFNTSGVNRTVYGGYAGYSEEMCIMLLHYYPRNALLRGCSAVTPQQGGHSVCMFEGAQAIWQQSFEADRVPIRTFLSPRSLPPLTGGQPQGLNVGYKASIVIFWLLALTAILWGLSAALGRCSWLGQLHTAYVDSTPAARRNMPVYLMHVVLDTLVLGVWFEPVFAGWCGCTEAGPSHSWLLSFNMLYIVVAYALELVWRARIDTMLAMHHVATILIISVLLGELAAELYLVADAVILLGVFAVLEQPTFVALLLQRTLPRGSVHVARAWTAAVWFWFASKTASLGMAIAFIVRDWGLMAPWVRGMYIGIWALVYSIQIWSGLIQRSIARAARARHAEQQLAAQLLPSKQPLAGAEEGGALGGSASPSCSGSGGSSSELHSLALGCSIEVVAEPGAAGKVKDVAAV